MTIYCGVCVSVRMYAFRCMRICVCVCVSLFIVYVWEQSHRRILIEIFHEIYTLLFLVWYYTIQYTHYILLLLFRFFTVFFCCCCCCFASLHCTRSSQSTPSYNISISMRCLCDMLSDIMSGAATSHRFSPNKQIGLFNIFLSSLLTSMLVTSLAKRIEV